MNDKQKRIKAVETFEDNHDAFRYVRKANKKSQSLCQQVQEKSCRKRVWQDEKDFILYVSLNSQNRHVYGFENKDNIQDNCIFHHTNRPSKKVMVSACVTWKGATKLFNSSLKHEKKSVFSKSIVL